MRLFLAIVLITILSAVAEFFLPWWSVAIVAFLITFLMRLKAGQSFLAGFVGVGICWFMAARQHDAVNEHILSGRMAQLFHLPDYGLFIAVTVFIGALVGGLAGWAGANSRPVTRNK
jgi:hypothetical protein